MEKVILVDKNDKEIGLMEKMEAHSKNLLHRAISVLVFNENGEMLLQKRARDKYHSNCLWTNAACTHPRQNEDNLLAANRRLKEEMGLEAELSKQFDFIYQAKLDNNLNEHELDHVFFGITNDKPNPNPEEVADYKYMNIGELYADVHMHPENYTEWFKIILDKSVNMIIEYLKLSEYEIA